MLATWDLSRKISLLVMLITSLAVLGASLVGSWQQYRGAKEQNNRQLNVLAEATAFNLASSSIFMDAKAAKETLAALSVDPQVVSANLLIINGEQLATYSRRGKGDQRIDSQFIVPVKWQDEEVARLFLNVNLSEVNNLFYRQIGMSLGIALAALLLAGLLAALLIRIITQPLRVLSHIAEKIGVNGDYALRAPQHPSRDEVGLLTHRFNAMLERIELQDIELRKQHDLLEHRVAERTLQLRLETERAEEASRAKSEFLAVMSHEIRTPLNGVLGMTSLLLDSSLDVKQKRFARVARRSGEDLLAIINDILDFSKIEAGKLELDARPFKINTLLEDLAERYAPIAQGKGVELLCATPLPPISVNADSARLAQVITNLLSNAIKFTESGEVLLSVKQEFSNDEIVLITFSVKDTGIGISPEQQKKLFNAFTQADSSMSRKYGGTGLGLVISQRLIELMGGEIQLESSLGHGSTFYFTLEFPLLKIQTGLELLQGFKQLRVMVVDDNVTNCEILDYWLQSWGVNAVVCHSAVDALIKLRQQHEQGLPVNLLLTDWMMPEMDGGQLVAALQEDARFDDLSIIVLSSAGMSQSIGLPSRVIYVVKPARQSELYDLLVAEVTGSGLKSRRIYQAETIGNGNEVGQFNVTVSLQGSVLLAEDNPVNQEVALAMLHKIGVSTKVAENGQEACKLLEAGKFDVILMDCQMPIMDGFEATAAIREREKHLGLPAIPIIALTANAILGDREACLERGMDDYLSKPFSVEQLYKILSQWLPESTVKSIAPPAITEMPNLHIDKKVIAQLIALREGLLPRVIYLFRSSSPALLESLAQAIASNNADNVYKTAHSLKNSAANLGVMELADLCRELELQARNGNLKSADAYLIKIQSTYKMALNILRQYEMGAGR